MLNSKRARLLTFGCVILLATFSTWKTAIVYSHPGLESAIGGKSFLASVTLLQQRIEELKNVHSLTEKQIRRLEVAAKGAAKMHLRDQDDLFPPDSEIPGWAVGWEAYYCRQNGTVFLGADAQHQCLMHHPIWLNAVNKILPDDCREEDMKRMKFRREHFSNVALLVIDEKLRLTDLQRQQLRPILVELVETRTQKIHCNQPNWLLLPVAEGIDNLPVAAIADVLRPDQVKLWDDADPMLNLMSEMDFNVPAAGFGGGGGGFGGGGGGFF